MTTRRNSGGSADRPRKRAAKRPAHKSPPARAKRQTAKSATAKSATVTRPAAKQRAKTGGRDNAASKGRERALHESPWVRGAVIAALLAISLFFVVYPIGTLVDQHAELDDVRARQAELTEEIAEIDSEIASLSGPEGTELRARCFAHYVRPGSEAYQVPGLSGCAEQP